MGTFRTPIDAVLQSYNRIRICTQVKGMVHCIMGFHYSWRESPLKCPLHT